MWRIMVECHGSHTSHVDCQHTVYPSRQEKTKRTRNGGDESED